MNRPPNTHSDTPRPTHALINALRQSGVAGQTIDARTGRETRQIEHDRQKHLLYLYPHTPGRIFRKRPAAVEYANLRRLVDLAVPAVQPIELVENVHLGDRSTGRSADALLVSEEAALPRLDLWIADQPGGLSHRHHRLLLGHVGDLLNRLESAGLGHDQLRLSTFVVRTDADNDPTGLLISDARRLTNHPLSAEHLWHLATDARQIATTADRVRVWMSGLVNAPLPRFNPHAASHFRQALSGQSWQKFRTGRWRGRFIVHADRPVAYSKTSRLICNVDEWTRTCETLLRQIDSGQLEVLKQDRGGEVFSGEITLNGLPVPVIVKRPHNKYWYRYILDIFRASRAARQLLRALWLDVRSIPAERGLCLIEKRVLGYVVDAMALYERVPGTAMDAVELDALDPASREMLFRRAGRILRQIEQTGLTHTDAKSSNWIIFSHPIQGPFPVLIDAYGIRRMNILLGLFGIRRLLRAMKNHSQYTPTDSLHLCLGFAPTSQPEKAADD